VQFFEMRSLRATLGVALLVAFSPDTADAQSHRLLARAGSQAQTESTTDVNVDFVEKLFELGVAGVNPSFFSHYAAADGAAGFMTLSSAFSRLGGAGDPIQPSSDPRSVARIEQFIDPGTPSGDVTLTATLTWAGAVSLTSGSGDVDGGAVAASLALDGCRVFFRRRSYSNGTSEDSPVVNCSSGVGIGFAGPGVLSVTITRSAASISSFTRYALEAQLEAEATFLDPLDSGEWQASAGLSVGVTGAPYTFASPTFLTVPEPAAVGANLVALGALFAWRRRRCVRGVS
jgi:hypothetical protein